MADLRIAIVGFGKIARDQHVGAIAAGDAAAASEAMVHVIHNGMRRHDGTVIETAPAAALPPVQSGERS